MDINWSFFLRLHFILKDLTSINIYADPGWFVLVSFDAGINDGPAQT